MAFNTNGDLFFHDGIKHLRMARRSSTTYEPSIELIQISGGFLKIWCYLDAVYIWYQNKIVRYNVTTKFTANPFISKSYTNVVIYDNGFFASSAESFDRVTYEDPEMPMIYNCGEGCL